MLDGATLPDGWAWAELKDLGSWHGGGTPSKSNSDYWTDGDIPWVSPKDMGADRLTGSQDKITRAATDQSSARLVDAPSIAFVVRSGILSRIFPVALVPFEAAFNQDMRVLTPSSLLNVDWLFYALRASAEHIRQTCSKHGVTVASIEVPRLMAYRIAVPPREEQDRIVEAVNEQLSRVTAGRTALNEALTQIDVYKAAALTAAVSGRLVARGPECTSAADDLDALLRLRDARWREAGMGRPIAPVEPTPIDGLKLPNGWAWATVDQLATGVQYGSSAKTSDTLEGAVPVLRMGNIVDGRLDLTHLKYLPANHDEFPALLLQDGDMLFNRTNSPELVGKTAVVRELPETFSFASYLIRVRFAPEIKPEYVSYFLNSPYGRAWVRANVSQQVGQANVNGSKLRAVTLPLPPREEQERICAAMDTLVAAEARLCADLAAATKDADTLTDSLFMSAAAGRLTRRVEPDEPAADLMVRVREQNTRLAQERRESRSKNRRAVTARR